MLTFVTYNLDLRNKQAVQLTRIDYTKAFNRQDHNNLDTIMYKLKVPGWLLNVIVGFLTNRKMLLAHNQGTGELKNMPGGGPAGTTLGLIMFVLLINDTANPSQKVRWGKLLTSPLTGRKPVTLTHGKLIDDTTIGEAIPLDTLTKLEDEDKWIRPLRQRESRQLIVPEGLDRTKWLWKK